jgi:type IV fimbrial biogenesis protein FimT
MDISKAVVSFKKGSAGMLRPMSHLAFTQHYSASPRSNAGFTLIELITVSTIVAILLAIGVPSFRYVTQANRSTSEINGLLGDLQFARAEAIREGQTVTVCPTTDQASCSGTTSWQTGWLVYSNTGVAPTPASILKVQKGFSADNLQSDNGITAVTFSREGFAQGLPNPITFTLHASPANAQYTRCLSLTIVGALSTQVGGATTLEGNPC